MHYTKNRITILLLTLLLLILALPACVIAEGLEVQEIAVSNTPIKGMIQLEKQGPVLTGFTEHQDAFGNMLHTPVYQTGYMEGAVFEIRAVEEIVGKDGTVWYKANELADTIVTTGKKADESKLLPLSHYYVTEVSAPAGYTFDGTRYDVLLEARNHEMPVVTVGIIANNDFMSTRISLVKEKQITSTLKDKDGMIHTTLVSIPGDGFVFGLYNSREIHYASGTLEAGSLIATAVSDKNGSVSFYGKFPAGDYDVREIAGPEKWKLDPANYIIRIPGDARVADHEMRISIDTPILNELV